MKYLPQLQADDRRRTDMRRSYLKEGAVQLTALDSLLTHSRYLFLFSDLLLVAKQKFVPSQHYFVKDSTSFVIAPLESKQFRV